MKLIKLSQTNFYFFQVDQDYLFFVTTILRTFFEAEAETRILPLYVTS